MLHEEEDTCLIEDDDHALPHARAGRPSVIVPGHLYYMCNISMCV
jgi:hypothetical protein